MNSKKNTSISYINQAHILSVSQLTKQIKGQLESQFDNIWISGEISNCKRHMSGHTYFSLKDEQSVIRAVFFYHQVSKLAFKLEDGLKVILHGNLSVYGKQGSYQIIADHAEPQGLGPLQLAFNQLKETLSKEGLFNSEHKQQIPSFPQRIGIVTSPTGAAIRDILNILQRRYSNVDVFIYPCKVQGEGASLDIANSIQLANEMNLVDVLIVGRGGGSIEDLWAFNEEAVARAIFKSKIPIISCVGHEIDYTISDYVADLRVPTPSAAAELVVESKETLNERLEHIYQRLEIHINNKIEDYQTQLNQLSDTTLNKCIAHRLNQANLQCDSIIQHLNLRIEKQYQRYLNLLNMNKEKLNALNPFSIMQRGYSISFLKEQNAPILLKDTSQLRLGDCIQVHLYKGILEAKVTHIATDNKPKQ